MNSPKRHHYLPRFYQEYFTNPDGFLWEFDRVKRIYQQKTPHGTGWQKNYYRYKGKDGKYYKDIETDLFQGIENESKPVIDKINNQQLISCEEKNILATFIAFQKTRVPEFQKLTEEIFEVGYKTINQINFDSINKTKEILDDPELKIINEDRVSAEEMYNFVQKGGYGVHVPREYSIKTMLRNGENMIGYFLQMNWSFLVCPPKTVFITSDNPFFIIPPKEQKDYFCNRGVGILTPKAMKVIPLSSNICLMMGNQGNCFNYVNINRKDTREINQMIAIYSDRYIIARDKPLLERIIKDTKIDRWTKEKRIEVG